MLCFKPKKYKCINQHEYDNEISLLIVILASFPCPYCQACSWILNGTYQRRICIPNASKFVSIKVKRVLCNNCNRTHALLPSTWLVRSPISTSTAILISDLISSQFSKFQNTYYPLTNKFLYTIIKKLRLFKEKHSDINSFTEDNPLLLRNLFNFSLYQHDGDHFYFLNVI